MTCAVLVPCDTAAISTSGWIDAVAHCVNVLKNLGYDPRVISHAATDAALEAETGDKYDFFVFPRKTDEIQPPEFDDTYNRLVVRGFSKIPVLCPFYQSGATRNGVTAPSGTNTYQKHQWSRHPSIYFYNYGKTYTLDPINGHAVDVILSDAADDRIAAWRYESVDSTTNAPVYCSSTFGAMYLPLLIHEAVIRGDIPAPTKKKQFTLDLDDFPDSNNTLSEITTIHEALVTHGLRVTCGIHGQSGPTYQDADVWAYLISHQRSNGGHFDIIDHQNAADDHHFDWDLTDQSGDITLETALTRHSAVWADLIANGVDDRGLGTGGWRFFNLNKVSIDGLVGLAGLGLTHARLYDTGTDPDGLLADCGFSGEICRQQGVQFYDYEPLTGNNNENVTGSQEDYISRRNHFIAMLRTSWQTGLVAFFGHNYDMYHGLVGGTTYTGNGLAEWLDNLEVLMALNTVFEPVADPTQFTRRK